MGQVALGFRSLAIRAAVFFVMAALLAWALGGTLWERTIDQDRHSARVGSISYYWRVSLSESEIHPVNWQLMKHPDGESEQMVEGMTFAEVTGPIAVDNAVYFGALESSNAWSIRRLEANGRVQSFSMPDRLAVEQQIARLRAGLEIQDEQTIRIQRAAVLDPAGSS